MKPFLDDNFLLETDLAAELYHDVAAKQPIIDYHCHLSPSQIADNHRFANLTEAWLGGDHYKWRAMRTNGVPERAITGDAPDFEKFEAWARTVPYTLRNPLYHWTHLELKFPFGIKDKLLNADTARAIYERANQQLATDEFTTQGLLKQYGVLIVCSTDDPVDSLDAHKKHLANSRAFTKLAPTWRPDKALALQDLTGWNTWIDALSASANVSIGTLQAFWDAIKKRHDFFHQLGCRASDHGLERLYAAEYTQKEVERIFEKARSRQSLTDDEVEKFRSAVLYEFALMDHARGWVQQFHLGALRNNNTRAHRTLGPDTGYDAIGDFPQAVALARFLDRLDDTNQLAKTIVYNLNPSDNEVFTTIIGSFQDGSVAGKMQFGSAWWFLDQLDGMEKQINALSNMGLLSRFVGMLTDSRSFLSYSRHEYFRRLLCNMLGNDVRRGMIPNDRGLLGNLVRDVSFRNARDYFQFPIDQTSV
jgi:glucuronate isomerase